MLILIPSRLDRPNDFMLDCAAAHFEKYGLKSVTIAIGGRATQPWSASSEMVVIPFSVANSLVRDACLGFPNASARIFGLGTPSLGFGGSSNLSQLIGLVCDSEWWVKLDDDCAITEFSIDGISDGVVGVGTFCESVPHPKELLIAAYPEISSRIRLSSGQRALPVQYLKNGALLMSRAAASLAPYPIMYSAPMGISLRGEAYDWASRFMALGGRIRPYPQFRVQHHRRTWNRNEWITQLLLKSDIVFSEAASLDGVRLNQELRHQNLVAALVGAKDLRIEDFRPLHEDSALYAEALALSRSARQDRLTCEAIWQRICAQVGRLRSRWIKAVPQLERQLFAWL